MKFRSLVLLNAFLVSISIACVDYYFQRDWYFMLLAYGVSFFLSFTVFYYLMERYVYSKIKLIYKLIHHLKLGKDLKDALGEHVSNDPINDVEQEVKLWASEKKIEIDALKKQEKFR